MTGTTTRPPGLRWSWPEAALGATYAIPAAVVATGDVGNGLALAVGMLPATITGLAPTRRERRRIAVSGLLVGVPMTIGAALSSVPWLAVPALFVLALAAVALARRRPAGLVAVNLGLPMVGIGLSFDLDDAVPLAVLMVVGSLVATAVSMLWPEQAPAAGSVAAGPTAPPALTDDYAIRLGLAGASAAAIGFALDLDHVGWACAAALLVMRPSVEMQQLRSVGRLASVVVGAAAAIAFVRAEPVDAWYALAIVAVLAGAAGSHRSRWYVTPAFTTYLVFLLLLHAAEQDAAGRFAERVSETALGVAIAYLFGLAIPALRARRGEGST